MGHLGLRWYASRDVLGLSLERVPWQETLAVSSTETNVDASQRVLCREHVLEGRLESKQGIG